MRTVCIVFALLAPIVTRAQYDMTSMFSMTSRPVMAIERGDIKKELKLSRDQDKSISKVESDLQQATRSGGQDMSLMGSMAGRYDEADKQIMTILDDGQRKRLNEIRVQMLGPAVMLDKELGKPLEVTDDQADKAKQIREAFLQDAFSDMRSHHDGGMQKRLEKKRDEADAKMLDLLNDAQRAKYKEIQGAPFKGARLKGIF